jgi:hypothetical protein
MHVHVSVIDFLIVVAYVTIWRFLANAVAARWPESSFGQALAVIAA